ncbi:thiolase family protein [Alicyclobacillus sp. SO9]|uniref:thiolase family protein n=1 Tax=Alicyclobacillus sp. SO9 TaxID=2665646 RepID=UPI0018E8D8DD|nr:thiolase family protein [Alicyclobacillus sp. SO9]QQE80777.1 thiolase family protein [Alicyclobacillus sp. SO9]
MAQAVIVDAARTPIGRRKGMFTGIHPVDLLAQLMTQTLHRNQLDPKLVDDVIIGCVDQVGEQGANIARNAWLSAGLPEAVPGTTIDRQCGSSLQALHFAAQGVMAGAYDIVVAGGVESMTRVPLMSTLNGSGTPMTQGLQIRYNLQDNWFNQAVGAEMIAKRWGLTRRELDEFSYLSHQRAAAARDKSAFENEIFPVRFRGVDGIEKLFTVDEGIRTNTTVEKMGQLSPAFEGLSVITAGNASQISDGASMSLVMSSDTAEEMGLKARARFISFAVVGVDPITMLTGPIPATQKVLKRAGLTIDDIDLFEVNEAFAPVVLAWQKETGVPLEKVNVNGGAIALGHRLGATGTRMTATLLNALEERDLRYGLMAVCEGGGMANATIIERLD